MRAISTFSLEAGISTFWCRALIALRMRANMSATGSVNLIVCFSSCHPFAPRPAENLQRRTSYFVVGRWYLVAAALADDWRPTTFLPGRLRNSGNLSPQRQPAEAKPADAELTQVSARTSA